jgi:hypothetical protein
MGTSIVGFFMNYSWESQFLLARMGMGNDGKCVSYSKPEKMIFF